MKNFRESVRKLYDQQRNLFICLLQCSRYQISARSDFYSLFRVNYELETDSLTSYGLVKSWRNKTLNLDVPAERTFLLLGLAKFRENGCGEVITTFDTE